MRSSPAEFVSADIAVLIQVEDCRNLVEVVCLELSKSVVAGAEHLVQISDFFFVGLEAGGLRSSRLSPAAKRCQDLRHKPGSRAIVEELRIIRATPQLSRLRAHQRGANMTPAIRRAVDMILFMGDSFH